MPITECLAWMEHWGFPIRVQPNGQWDNEPDKGFTSAIAQSDLSDISNILSLRITTLKVNPL